jgi:hypothetical protein
MLLGKATNQQLEAMNRLRAAPELEGVKTLLQSQLNDTMSALVKADDQVTVYRLQGRVAMIQDFLESLEKVPEVMNRKRT